MIRTSTWMNHWFSAIIAIWNGLGLSSVVKLGLNENYYYIRVLNTRNVATLVVNTIHLITNWKNFSKLIIYNLSHVLSNIMTICPFQTLEEGLQLIDGTSNCPINGAVEHFQYQGEWWRQRMRFQNIFTPHWCYRRCDIWWPFFLMAPFIPTNIFEKSNSSVSTHIRVDMTVDTLALGMSVVIFLN